MSTRPASSPDPRRASIERARASTRAYYDLLRREVTEGNPGLDGEERARLAAHYPVMLTPERNPPGLAAEIYAERRQYPVVVIQSAHAPVALDAGCGFGSESFLFASQGARVLAVDADPERIRIAQRRQAYFENALGCQLEIEFQVADLDSYEPARGELTMTWLASVLAALKRQEEFLSRVRAATRGGGRILVSDMNLWNPLFVVGEWQRRRRAARTNAPFAAVADFGAMWARRGRSGARYWTHEGQAFDDVQFFQPESLRQLLQATGWRDVEMHFSGYVPPTLARRGFTMLERLGPRLPLLRQLGYFYLGIGVK